ncbi:hypothetical protein D0B54_00070 [Solimonas sp. K1W22B-7]|nr:hypothetical protein D0B54_00070 [Solimonas sp. K1W22B-7]
MREFLETYKGDRIAMFTDHDDAERIDSFGLSKKPGKKFVSQLKKKDFLHGRFRIENSALGKSYTTQSADWFVPLKSGKVSSVGIKRFIKRLVSPSMAPDSLVNTFGVLAWYEDLGPIAELVKEANSGGHDLTISVIPEKA